jgi:hypothetical protein
VFWPIRWRKEKEKIGGRDRVRTCDPLLAKQVLSQLSYTPTFGATFILRHFRALRDPFLRFSVITVPKLYQNSPLPSAFLVLDGERGALSS